MQRPLRTLALFLSLAAAAAAGTALELDLQGLVDRSELVIEGRVLSRRCFPDSHGRPETEYVVAVDVPYLGGPEALRTFRFPGGRLPGKDGGTALVVPGLPELEVGEEVILFLTREGAQGWRMPVGLSQGKYRKVEDADGQVHAVREHGQLDLYDPQTRTVRRAAPNDRTDHAELRRRIERAVALRKAREESAGKER